MHLKQLKLAGFKSFVDPTVAYFPSQLVAVVGPNGCGKSNIIDAVRWVMGESAAKNLRGESMIDVIFNGSSHRKAVGQASVELVFDNSLGRLTGPFASYGEIAVKRVVTRDGDSSYYLNGSRCRRKDITDIFLGTGAGARGYSIIGQGTISQLIEAKPEELRVFLEEAAGVSKYKERRRETLQRIVQTRENLTRVADIKDELEKQLQRLGRQAKAAERYLLLKEKEQLCRAEILALKWYDWLTQQQEKQCQLQELAIQYEQQQSVLAKGNKERLILTEKTHDLEEKTQQTQISFYQLGTEIARLEETIEQQTREQKRLEHDQQQLQNECQELAHQVQQDQNELVYCQQNTQDLANQLEQLRSQCSTQENQCQEAQEQHAQWEQRWQEEQSHGNTLKREFQVAQIQAQHLDEKYQKTCCRLETLKMEQASISLNELKQTEKELEEQHLKLLVEQEHTTFQLSQSQETQEQLHTQLQEIEQQLHGLQDEFHQVNTECSALIAAQNAARQEVKKNKAGIQQWSEKPRLMDVLHVESQWQNACEHVLNETLHAYVLHSFDELMPHREHCVQHGENVVTLKPRKRLVDTRPRLVDKIQGLIPAHVVLLEHIFLAEHIDAAFDGLAELEEHQSIITPEGFWLGPGWVKCASVGALDEPGFLARQQKIEDLSLVVQALQQQIALMKTARDQMHQQVQEGVKNVAQQQRYVNDSNEAIRTNHSARATNELALLQAEKQQERLMHECDELQTQLYEMATERLSLQEKILSLESQCLDSEKRQEESLCEKQTCFEKVTLKKKYLEELRLQSHHAELDHDREKNKMQQLDERIQKDEERFAVLQERLEQVILLCIKIDNPGLDQKENLIQRLQKQNEVNSQLTLYKEQLAQLSMELEEYEKSILNCDFEVKRLHELIAQVRLEEQALSVRASSVQESLDELGLQAQKVLEQIPAGVTKELREDELITLTEQIKCLGAINLAAIEEFATEQQRQLYLEEQYNDLSQAMVVLETAIDKMDKETRLRLENTFEEVNTSFKSLFPRLFGGGVAQLVLTCDNLLEAGIVVMAQPPGKRNSTIHLLSGGEKAMTAVALVFALFQLNPSPFCMLDEVDAPLDDVNVGRFCTLVKEMSQFVQFLFITHNKVTMELADHLIGVTMREPGVSRLVAVDVTQALTME